MSISNRYKITSHTYQQAKINKSQSQKKIKGKLHPSYGKPSGRTSDDFTNEWKENISKSKKGKSSWNKGIPRSQETKDKMSKTRKERSKNPNWNIRPPCSKEKAEKIKKANLGKKWVHRFEPVERKYINGSILSDYLKNGWIIGLGPKKKI